MNITFEVWWAEHIPQRTPTELDEFIKSVAKLAWDAGRADMKHTLQLGQVRMALKEHPNLVLVTRDAWNESFLEL